MPKLFAVSIILFLLLGAGYGFTQAARSIPWDCSDWQAFAHEDRTTAILESLAENRGKTLYCGIDQSDTFSKAETWAAGKDRNERDDTVYWGERGSFRGFIAAQEGWLTEGESGITGQSIAVIFEFPKEERGGRRVKRSTIGGGVSSCGVDADGNDILPQGADGVATGCPFNGHSLAAATRSAARLSYGTRANGPDPSNNPNPAPWQDYAERKAAFACRGGRVANLEIDADWNSISPSAATHPAWRYRVAGTGLERAYQIRDWTATCIKRGRRRR